MVIWLYLIGHSLVHEIYVYISARFPLVCADVLFETAGLRSLASQTIFCCFLFYSHFWWWYSTDPSTITFITHHAIPGHHVFVSMIQRKSIHPLLTHRFRLLIFCWHLPRKLGFFLHFLPIFPFQHPEINRLPGFRCQASGSVTSCWSGKPWRRMTPRPGGLRPRADCNQRRGWERQTQLAKWKITIFHRKIMVNQLWLGHF